MKVFFFEKLRRVFARWVIRVFSPTIRLLFAAFIDPIDIEVTFDVFTGAENSMDLIKSHRLIQTQGNFHILLLPNWID